MRFVVLFLVLLFPCLPAAAAQVAQKPEPGWIEPLPIPKPSTDRLDEARNGVLYLVYDTQIRWQGEVRQTYRRIAMKVLNRAGLETAASLLRDFDPRSETLTATRLNVIRDGKTISHLGSIEPQVYRRETQLDRGIIDGTLTAHFEIPDVRVGDVVDVGFLWSRTPLFAGATRAGELRIGFSVPVVDARVILDWPNEWPFHVSVWHPEEMTHRTVTERGVTQQVWERGDLPVRRAEKRVPAWYPNRAGLRYSANDSWEPVEAALHAYYSRDEALPESWQKKVEAIRAASSDPADRAIAALRLVQREIRYVGVEIGRSGYFAQPPAEVIANGFGDCKGKAVLLETVLHRLGLPAGVALAAVDTGQGLAKEPPGADLFDHMITWTRVAGRLYWMDPTAQFEGGTLANAVTPDYGYVLRVGRDAPGKLEKLVRPLSQTYAMTLFEDHHFSEAGDRIEVTTRYQGDAANIARSDWATRAVRDIRDQFLDYYRQYYPGITVAAPARGTDNREANTFEVHEHYLVPMKAIRDNDLLQHYPFVGPEIDKYYPDSLPAPRMAPLAQREPRSILHRVTVENAPIDFNPPKSLSLDNPAFSYSFDGTSSKGGYMALTWQFSSWKHWVPADLAQKVVRDARKMTHDLYFSWDLSKTKAKKATPAKATP
ncbi:DUF3857 domain-containing protein [Acidimangrovimonas pyrenivorans]|uniref:DUF3857 domain-containing protein n=1 Tax=Acidimangrovimonas pyrenivorans TaxID=2030798 RepID=A0ABV7AJE1_9RHOB